MEAAGLSFGVVGILSGFQTCVRLYGDVLSLRSRDEDVEAAKLRIRVELNTFQRLKDILGYDTGPSAQSTKGLFQALLAWIDADLTRIRDLLARHAQTKAVSTSTEMVTGPGVGGSSTKMKRLAHGVTWLAHDKERLNSLVERLQEWNEALARLVPEIKRERIKYEVMSESIATNSPPRLEHIEHATQGQYPLLSKRAAVRSMTLRSRGNLGPSQYAASLASSQFQISLESFEWMHSSTGLDKVMSLERAFAVYRPHKITSPGTPGERNEATLVMVEWRDNFRSEESFKQFGYRLDYLVKILRKMGSDGGAQGGEFNILPCCGWITTSPSFDHIGLVFHLPGLDVPPSTTLAVMTNLSTPLVLSLNDRMRQTRSERTNAPPLGERFKLAYALARNIETMLSVGWVHKEFRSHNILFVQDNKNGQELDAYSAVFFLAGLTYARPSRHTSKDISVLSQSPVYDLYRPPHKVMMKHQEQQYINTQLSSKVQNLSLDPGSDGGSNSNDDDEDAPVSTPLPPPVNWTCAMDIYGLGIVLLEIGLWRTIQDLKGDRASKSSFLSRDLDRIVESLSYRMGNLYMGVVKRCLALGDYVDEEEKLRPFLADIIENIGLCRA